MDASTRDLTALERAIQAFNAGADPSAGALQRAFLEGQVCVLSPSEVSADGNIPGLLALDGGDGESYLEVFTHEDRVPQDVGRRYPWMVRTSGASVLDLAKSGVTVNPGSDATLAVAVKSGGVEEMRVLLRSRQTAIDARGSRAPHELETFIAGLNRDHLDAVTALRLGVVLWPTVLFVPSSRPLEGVDTIDLDACFTFGSDDDRMLAAFTDLDQLGEFASGHLLETTGGDLFHRLPDASGIYVNPQRPDQLPLTGEGLRVIANLIERPVAPVAPAAPLAPDASARKRRGLFGRRSD